MDRSPVTATRHHDDTESATSAGEGAPAGHAGDPDWTASLGFEPALASLPLADYLQYSARLDAADGTVGQGASTAFEAARILTWTRRERALDDLDPFNQMLAILETAAHLDLLVMQGRLRALVSNGVTHYGAP